MLCQTLRMTIKSRNFIGYTNAFNQLVTYSKQFNEHLQLRLLPLVSNFCTQELPKKSDIFGDISGRNFQHVEMDAIEQEEEKFQDTEACIPRRLKPSLGQYTKMMKLHISENNLNSALKVLDKIKENRDKPIMYLYNLLVRAFAKQGDIKQCFHLYNRAKQRGLKPNAATYTSLFNACAESKNSIVAMEYLNKLRHLLYLQHFPLNEAHYNSMIKAYSWHNQIAEAFQLADEMRDKRIPIGESTYNSLLHGAISDKETGLRHALIIWHFMRLQNIKPSLTTYNLFLRAIRDTNLGNLKLDDNLISGLDKTRILLKEGERPDLLASPPILSNLLPLKLSVKEQNKEKNVVQCNSSVKKQEDLINLDDVLINNRLILFGGLEGILNRIIENGVEPDAKTITLLLDLIPNTVLAENELIKISDKKNIKLDIDFYNMLIKRRNMRFDHKAAKEVISMAEQKNLSPNVMTFGVLALGCQNYDNAKQFLEGIETFGYKPNAVIMSTLINIACRYKDLNYLLFIMNYMMDYEVKPNMEAVKAVKEFAKGLSKIEKPTGKYKVRKQKRLEKNIEKFEEQYPKWLNMIKK